METEKREIQGDKTQENKKKPQIIEILCCVPLQHRRQLLDWCNLNREFLFSDENPVSLTDEELGGEKVEKYIMDRIVNGLPDNPILKYVFTSSFLFRDDIRNNLIKHVYDIKLANMMDDLYQDEWDDYSD
jgi:hypothetical protein